jgi:hypothetical protein
VTPSLREHPGGLHGPAVNVTVEFANPMSGLPSGEDANLTTQPGRVKLDSQEDREDP